MIPKFLQKFCVLISLTLLLYACGSNQPQLTPLKRKDTILAFGDSLTEGFGTSEARSYPAVLEKLINMTVINSGIAGNTTEDGLERLPDVLEEYHPQLVLLCLGGNDMLRKIPQATIKKNLQIMISMIKKSKAEIILIAEPEPTLTLKPPALYRELAEENEIPLEEHLLPSLLKDKKYKSDTIHLNQEGYRLFAEGIKELLIEVGAIEKN